MFIHHTGRGFGGITPNPANLVLLQEEDEYSRAMRAPAGAASIASGATGSGYPGGGIPPGDPTHQPFDAKTVGDNELIKGAQGTRIAVYSLMLYNSGDALNIRVLDGAVDLMGIVKAVSSGMGLFLPPADYPYFTLTPGNSFILNLSDPGVGKSAEITGYVKFKMLDAGAIS